METIVREHVMSHMARNALFNTKQFGFLPGQSTTLELLKVLDEWLEIIDDHGSLDVVYCDFRKAFDTVPHRHLITKLESYGITGEVNDWIN